MTEMRRRRIEISCITSDANVIDLNNFDFLMWTGCRSPNDFSGQRTVRAPSQPQQPVGFPLSVTVLSWVRTRRYVPDLARETVRGPHFELFRPVFLVSTKKNGNRKHLPGSVRFAKAQNVRFWPILAVLGPGLDRNSPGRHF